jgi:hypothetical protein
MKAVPSSLKRAKPRMNTGLDATGRRLEDRFSSRAMFWAIYSSNLPRLGDLPKNSEGFTPGLHFQVNTLDETSLIQVNVGTNYTIGPRASELARRKQPISTTKKRMFFEIYYSPYFFMRWRKER